MADMGSDGPAARPDKRKMDYKGGAGYAEKGGGRNKRNKVQTPAFLLKCEVESASAKDDVKAGLEAFQRAVTEELQLQPHTYNVLLRLCTLVTSSADAQTQYDVSSSTANDAAGRVFEHMKSNGVKATEATYTALARVAAGNGDPARAFALVDECKAAGLDTKLRTFSPALVAFCEAGQLDHAFKVEEAMRANGTPPLQTELRALLAAAVASRSTEAVAAALKKLAAGLSKVDEATAAVLTQWFQSVEAAAGAGDGFKWQVGRGKVADDGTCTATGAKLRSIDLTPEERESLAAGIAKLATEREHAERFEKFGEWLEKNGPLETFVDGANVGMYGMNFEKAEFSFKQLDTLMSYLQTRKRAEGYQGPLVVLHEHRCSRGPGRYPASQQIQRAWTKAGVLWTTPPGSNDDWYWLYGAVKSGEKCFLVTNDEMRDHIFQMLPEPRLFNLWKDRHQVRFTFNRGQAICMFPLPYSTCIQQLDDGSWYLPLEAGDDAEDEDEKWFFVHRVPV